METGEGNRSMECLGRAVELLERDFKEHGSYLKFKTRCLFKMGKICKDIRRDAAMARDYFEKAQEVATE